MHRQFEKLMDIFQKEMTNEMMRILHAKLGAMPSRQAIQQAMVPLPLLVG